jgi:transketolase N-terminal domain/subunit
MGQLWENSRVAQYVRLSNIIALIEKLWEHQSIETKIRIANQKNTINQMLNG